MSVRSIRPWRPEPWRYPGRQPGSPRRPGSPGHGARGFCAAGLVLASSAPPACEPRTWRPRPPRRRPGPCGLSAAGRGLQPTRRRPASPGHGVRGLRATDLIPWPPRRRLGACSLRVAGSSSLRSAGQGTCGLPPPPWVSTASTPPAREPHASRGRRLLVKAPVV